MKVEYSYYGDMPSLIIKGTDFVKALKDREELNLLEISVFIRVYLRLFFILGLIFQVLLTKLSKSDF
jgi:hypothetical protein